METELEPMPPGLTRDAGWQLGVRRTVPAHVDEVWRRLLSEWLPAWLGVDTVPQMVGAPLCSGGSLHGRIVGCHVGRRVRVRWTRAAGWAMGTAARGSGTTSPRRRRPARRMRMRI